MRETETRETGSEVMMMNESELVCIDESDA